VNYYKKTEVHFDFIAYGLSNEGQRFRIVMPQRLPIPANAIYRKYTASKGILGFFSPPRVTIGHHPATLVGHLVLCSGK
jgi:hypothetical protein